MDSAEKIYKSGGAKRWLIWRPWLSETLAPKPKHYVLPWGVLWSLSQTTWLIFQTGLVCLLLLLPLDLILHGGHLAPPFLNAIYLVLLAFAISGWSIGCAHLLRRLSERRKLQ